MIDAWCIMRKRICILAWCIVVAVPLAVRGEIVLVPIGGTDAPIPGALGSQWVVEEFVRNTSASGIDYLLPNCPLGFCAFTFQPNVTIARVAGPFEYFAIAGSADAVRFAVTVRDVSSQRETWGAQIPAVRERDLYSDRFEIIAVPTDLAFRRNLRVYTVRTTTDVNGISVLRVRVYDAQEDASGRERLLGERQYTIDSSRGPAPEYVGYVMDSQIDDLFAGTNADRVRIVVERLAGTAKLWGFVTLTNNDTHHVTIIAP